MITNFEFLRLASSLSNLSKGYLKYSWQLPDPVLALYNESSVRTNRVDGSQSLRGQRSVTLTWNNLGPTDAWLLRKLVDDAIMMGGDLYLTINLNWTVAGAPGHWIDVKGRVHIPTGQQGENTLGALQSQFVLTANRLTTINDPASF